MLTNAQRVELSAAIARAITWLDSDQPESSWITHHGIHYDRMVGSTELSLAPVARGRPVFVFTDDREHDGYTSRPDKPRWYGYSIEEVEELKALVTEHAEIAATWNGESCVSYSVALVRSAGPGVWEATAHYRNHNPFDAEYWKGQPRVIRPIGWC